MRKKDPIHIHVTFPCALDRSSSAKVVSDLLKSLLHQRGQIPLQYDALVKEAAAATKAKENAEGEAAAAETVETVARTVSREEARLAREQVRRGKARRRNLEEAGRFLETSGEVLATLEQELTSGPTTSSVTLLFGATHLSPREAYTLHLPSSSSPSTPPPSLGVHLLRAIVMSEDFCQLSSTRIPISNVYICLHRPSSSPLSSSSSAHGVKILPSLCIPPRFVSPTPTSVSC